MKELPFCKNRRSKEKDEEKEEDEERFEMSISKCTQFLRRCAGTHSIGWSKEKEGRKKGVVRG